jgi:hypothetical protein
MSGEVGAATAERQFDFPKPNPIFPKFCPNPVKFGQRQSKEILEFPSPN